MADEVQEAPKSVNKESDKESCKSGKKVRVKQTEEEKKLKRIEYIKRYYSKPENRERMLKYKSEYNSRPEVLARKREYNKRCYMKEREKNKVTNTDTENKINI